jgi:hypothetical protein
MQNQDEHDDITLRERIMKVEVLLTNHLHHHEIWITGIIIPLSVASVIGIVTLIVKIFFFNGN